MASTAEQKSNTVGAGNHAKIEMKRKQTKGTCTISDNMSVLMEPNSLSDPCSLFSPLSENDEIFRSTLGKVKSKTFIVDTFLSHHWKLS
jgi:hypothetical protein